MTRRLTQFFELEKIKMYVLKGVSIAQYYPNPHYRFSCDMDCLLSSISATEYISRFEEGNILLEQKGGKVIRDYYKHAEFSLNGLHVENHRFCCSVKRGKRTKELESYLQGIVKPMHDEKTDGLYFPSLIFQAFFLLSMRARIFYMIRLI